VRREVVPVWQKKKPVRHKCSMLTKTGHALAG
jgi:hypothetical protein